MTMAAVAEVMMAAVAEVMMAAVVAVAVAARILAVASALMKSCIAVSSNAPAPFLAALM
jgi:hypothetical protein